MANSEHVALLKKGMVEWNAWRRMNPRTVPDLSGVDLSALGIVDLRGFNLGYANFKGSDLHAIDASEAIFVHANLNGVYFGEAGDLSGTDLSGADLQLARLLANRTARA